MTSKLAIFDFDMTLFQCPHPPTDWDPEREGDWWALGISLGPPCVPKIAGPEWWNQCAVSAARCRIRSPDWYCCLLTGRSRTEANFQHRILALLKQQDLDFDEILLSPQDRTSRWKIRKTRELATRLQPKLIEQWDDRLDHLQEFKQQLGTAFSIKQHHVRVPPKPCGSFIYRGRRYIAQD
jgi:hypothetical protein